MSSVDTNECGDANNVEKSSPIKVSLGFTIGLIAVSLFVGFSLGRVDMNREKQPETSKVPKICWEEMDKRYVTVAQIQQVDAVLNMSYQAFSNMNSRVQRTEQYLVVVDKVFGMVNEALTRHEKALSNLTENVSVKAPAPAPVTRKR